MTVVARLRRLDERFGAAPRGPRLTLSERKELSNAIRQNRTGEVDPELVRAGRVWARRVLSRPQHRTQWALVVISGWTLALGLVLTIVEGRQWIVYASVGAVNLPLQMTIWQMIRRQAQAIVKAFPPRPTASS